MFNKLIDLLITFIGLFQCWTYVAPYERGVVLRKGLLDRVIGPGWQWLVPAGFEKYITENIRPEPVKLEVQWLHTKDNYAANISVAAEYEIFDIETHILEFEESFTTNCLIAAGVISTHVQDSKFNAVTNASVSSLKSKINRKIKKRGGRFTELVLTDLSNGEAIRYWHEGIELDFGGEE